MKKHDQQEYQTIALRFKIVVMILILTLIIIAVWKI